MRTYFYIVTQTHSVDNFQIMSMAALELFVRDLMEWKLALLAVPTLIIAWLSCKFLFLDAFMSPLRNLPGPPTSMFLGNLLEFKRKDSFSATSEWSKKYGGIFVMWLRPGMYVFFFNFPFIYRWTYESHLHSRGVNDENKIMGHFCEKKKLNHAYLDHRLLFVTSLDRLFLGTLFNITVFCEESCMFRKGFTEV